MVLNKFWVSRLVSAANNMQLDNVIDGSFSACSSRMHEI